MRAEWFGIQVKTQSGNEQRCLCPFHADKHASASFNMAKGVFFCHTCKIAYRASFLAHMLGISMEEIDSQRYTNVPTFEMVTEEEDISADAFEWSPEAELYWSRRTELPHEGIEYSDRYKGIVFPLKRLDGLRIGSMVRYIQPKTSRYRLFGHRPPLWPIDKLRRKAPLTVVVEGFFSQIKFNEVVENRTNGQVMCMLGSSLTTDVQEVVGQLDGPVIFLLDKDTAGEQCAKKAKRLFPHTSQFLVSRLDELNRPQMERVLTTIMRMSL